jgi:hypothetical protein
VVIYVKLLEIKKPSEDIISQVNSLESEKGKIVAIETETEEWFLGENVITALKNARSKYPNGIFYFTRVGYPSAHEHKDDIKRL